MSSQAPVQEICCNCGVVFWMTAQLNNARRADAIRAAGYRRLSAAPPTLEVGWRVVPETPTRAMLVAGDTNGLGCRMGNLDFVHDIYSNMIAAAPLPSPPDAGSGGIAATKPQALDELISSDELAEMDLLAERSAGLAFAGTVRRLVAAYRSLAPTPSDEIRERVAVEEIETCRLDGADPTAPGEPLFRVNVGGRCFDFDSELEARNLQRAILALYTGRGE